MEKSRLTITEAIEILGPNNCVSPDKASMLWGLPNPGKCFVPYARETLEKASMDIIMGRKYWILVWIHGLSLQEQIEIRGSDRNDQPCFYQHYPYCLKHHLEWAYYKAGPDYYLINMDADIKELNHEETEARVNELGPSLVWCEESVFSEAVLTYYMATRIRIFEHWYHRGRNVYKGRSTIIGSFNINGLDINGHSQAHRSRDVKTVLYQKQL